MTFTLHPRLKADCTHLGDFPLCRVLLAGDARYAWFILVPRRDGIREAYEMTDADQDTLTRESAAFGKAIMQAYTGDKLNIGALGNMVPQLHIHHIVRHEGDAAWPGAVWGQGEAVAYEERQIKELKETLARLDLPGFKLA